MAPGDDVETAATVAAGSGVPMDEEYVFIAFGRMCEFQRKEGIASAWGLSRRAGIWQVWLVDGASNRYEAEGEKLETAIGRLGDVIDRRRKGLN